MVRNCGITCNFQFYQFCQSHQSVSSVKLTLLRLFGIACKNLMKDFERLSEIQSFDQTNLNLACHSSYKPDMIELNWPVYYEHKVAILVKFCTNVLRSLWSCHQKAFSYLTVIHRSGIMQGLILTSPCWLANANPINASHTFSFCLKKASLLLSSDHSKSLLL